jgi:DNA modification methylase
VEIEFYCKDAREEFLRPESVDLFLVHPPFFNTHPDHYGGDLSLQLHRSEEKQTFIDSIVKSVNNMSKALKPDGSILMVVPNVNETFDIISNIIKSTNLRIHRTLFWNFEKSYFVQAITGGETNLILHMSKNEQYPYPIEGMTSFVINQIWTPSDIDVLKYREIGFVYDSFPHELSDLLVPLFSKEGDVVADIFGGTGTVCISALKNNRKAIYNDASFIQAEIAKKRIDAIMDTTPKEKEMNAGAPTGQFSPNDMIFDSEAQIKERERFIHVMSSTVENVNRKMAMSQGPQALEQVEAWIESQRAQLEMMNNEIYNALKEAELI